ncbi:LysR family transcriptional regulator [Motilimonas cestriensis]|uniref:LysR family transcriptional regulator n=1 Tax=Motilimonas cestriensis TaxID=2742685 RepID=UPI003DA3F757
MTKINQLESLKVLKAVVECGSFTVAAQRLNISAARVSKSIERLEIELGTVLFNRSTRHMQITDSGEHCYARAVSLINQWQGLKEELVESHSNPRGKLRISAPMTWGLAKLAPLIDTFMLKYPEIMLDVQLSDEHVNVLEDQFDLVLRLTRQLPDSSLIGRKITDYRLVPCASPDYLNHHGQPQHPTELKDHSCLMYSLVGASRKWQFFDKRKRLDIFLDPSLVSNNSKLLHVALLAGRGVALIPDFIVNEDLAAQRLVPILQDFQTARLNLYSLRPGNHMPSLRLKVLHDYLCQCLGDS